MGSRTDLALSPEGCPAKPARGFEEPGIRRAYILAEASGTYNSVDRRDSEGRVRKDRAYAMTNHKEYFAEATEAFFTTNDFFPFTKDELKKHDPAIFAQLEKVWAGPPKK